MRVALFAVASPQFDLGLARQVASGALLALRAAGHVVDGSELLTDRHAADAAAERSGAEVTVILHATFTDSTLPMAAAARGERLVLWSVPEPRTGERLRLHSLAGMNLAGHALTKAGRHYRWLYAQPEDRSIASRLDNAISGPQPFVPRSARQEETDLPSTALMRADELRRRLANTIVGVIGDHPEGFEPSAYDVGRTIDVTGIRVERVELDDLFRAGAAADDQALGSVRERAERRLGELDKLDASAVTASLRLHCGLRSLIREHHWAGVATRCWPECFTVYGGAACTATALLTDDGIPGSCEADVYGVVTSLLLQAVADEPAFVAELADLDVETNTGAFWHCGNAPHHMANLAAPVRATVHPTRGLPLASEFALRPGRVTIARLSQAGGDEQLVIGGGEMLDEPLPFAGTAGVVRLDHPAERVLETVMGRGLEHHYGIVYGDHHTTLAAVANRWGLPVLSL